MRFSMEKPLGSLSLPMMPEISLSAASCSWAILSAPSRTALIYPDKRIPALLHKKEYFPPKKLGLALAESQ
jgi:hypothetical protein